MSRECRSGPAVQSSGLTVATISALLALAIHSSIAAGQVTSITETARWALPSDFIPEYIVVTESAGILVGQRGIPSIWALENDGKSTLLPIRCPGTPSLVTGWRSNLVLLDSARGTLSVAAPTGECLWTHPFRQSLSYMRDAVMSGDTLLVLSSTQVVRPDSVAVQKVEISTSGPALSDARSVIDLPASIRRPALDFSLGEWQIVDRQYPFMALTGASLRTLVPPVPGLSEAAMTKGVLLDSFWVALPTIRIDASTFLRTVVDLRTDARLIVQRNCYGAISRVTPLNEVMALISFIPQSGSLVGVERDQVVSIVRYSFQLQPGESPCPRLR